MIDFKNLTNKILPLDYLVVLSMPIIAAIITIQFQTTQVISLFLFFILPSLYLTIRQPRFLKKLLLITICTIPFTIIIDYFAIKDGSWWVYTIFPFRFLNGIPLEDFIWVASWFYYVLIFYEFFIDQAYWQKDALVNRKYKYLISGWFASLLVFAFLYFFMEKYLFIPYFYFVFTIFLGVLPLGLLILKRPQFLLKYSKALIYFFSVNFLHEISALSTNQWIFPGHNFIGWVRIFNYEFPFEELALWMFLGAAYLLAWYEYFIDDTK